MLSARLKALIGAVALAGCSTHALADYGRTTGTFNVSGGAATYTLPIWTPPGPNGVAPTIALTHSSMSGNGVGGVGWNLSAVSMIERCSRNKHQDASAAPVDLTMNDRFCLGGNRLRLSSGTYGAAGSVCFTELADYSRELGTLGWGRSRCFVQ